MHIILACLFPWFHIFHRFFNMSTFHSIPFLFYLPISSEIHSSKRLRLSILCFCVSCLTPARDYFNHIETLPFPAKEKCYKNHSNLGTCSEKLMKLRTYLTRSPILTWHMSHSLPWNPTPHSHFPHMHCPWSEQIVYSKQEKTRLSLKLRMEDACKLRKKNPNNSFR